MQKNIPHTIPAALEVTGLTEDEAYFILRFAGRVGYMKAIARLDGRPLHQLRKWFVWIGGWEHSALSQWDRGKPAWEPIGEKGQWRSPTPISFFGHTITIYGRSFDVRIFSNTLVIHKPDHLGGWGVYFSPDSTPSHPQARFWIDQRGYSQRRMG